MFSTAALLGLESVVPREQACPPDAASWVCEPVYDSMGPAWAVRAEWLVSKPLTILLVLVAAFIVNRIARYCIKRSLNRLLQPPSDRARRAQRALRRAAPAALLRTSPLNLRIDARVQTLTTVFRSITSVLIWFVAGVTIMQVVGVNVTSLVAISSVAGVAIGFGAQNVVRDFLAGMFIVLEDQFGVGDTVDIGDDAKGKVEELTLRTTRVRDVNGTLWHVPNGQIKRVANKSQEWARAVLDIEVDGATRYERVAPLIQKVAEGMASEERWMPEMLESPEVWGVEAFTEAGYTVRTVVKTRPASQFRIMRELRIRLLDVFRAEGILLPGHHWAVEHGPPEGRDEIPAGAGPSANGSQAPVDGDASLVGTGGRGPRHRPDPRSTAAIGTPAIRPGSGPGPGSDDAETAGPDPGKDGAAEEEA
jgi:small-conductance mechanosensitive channel